LRAGWFTLDVSEPVVTLPGTLTKNGKAATLPLPTELAATLRAHLRLKTPDAAVFPMMPDSCDTAPMFRDDLAAARAAWLDAKGLTAEQRAERERSDYLCDKRHNGRVLTFHSCRHTYIANLKRAGVPLTTAMQLARHSDPKLTARRYGTLGLHDLAGAVARLPIFTTPPEAAVREGTNDAPVSAANPPAVLADCLALSGTRGPTLVDSAGRQDSAKRCAETPEKLGENAENAGKTGTCHRSSIRQSSGFVNRRFGVRVPAVACSHRGARSRITERTVQRTSRRSSTSTVAPRP